MANKFQVEIQETVEELEHRLERAITAVSKEKLLLLYWIATKKIKTREELATMLNRDSSTIYRWLRPYKLTNKVESPHYSQLKKLPEGLHIYHPKSEKD